MPGNGDQLRASLRDGIGEGLAQALDFDRLAARLGRADVERAALREAVEERSAGIQLADRFGPAARHLHQLGIGAFGADLANRFNGQCYGYVIRLLEPGGAGLTMRSGKARGPADGDVPWNEDVRMHVASVSKLVTAMAARKLLADVGVPASTGIAAYLPSYWRRGVNIDRITFEMLLTHRSGFYAPVTDFARYGELKAQIARGALLGVDLGQQTYQNVNFAMFRVLVPVLTGDLSVALQAPSGDEADTDQLWDQLTRTAFEDYVRRNVLDPAGVLGATTASGPGFAMAYRWPMPGAGWDSGDLSSISGTTGWHLSANELVRLVAAFVGGAVVPARSAWAMLEQGWGLDRSLPTRAGPLFLKAGRWESTGKQLVQSVAGVLPGGLPFALLVNSQLGADTPRLVDTVVAAVLAHVVPIG